MEQAYNSFLRALEDASKDLSKFSVDWSSLWKIDLSLPEIGFNWMQGSMLTAATESVSQNAADAVDQLAYLGSTMGDLAVLIFSSRATRHMTFFLLFNVIVMFLEYHIGHTNNSAGLMSDATHMLNDNLALMIGIVATAASSWKENESYTYGFERVRTLSAFVQSVLLISFASRGFMKSLFRVFWPVEIDMDGLLLTSIIGLAVNILGVILLQTEDFEHGHDHGHGHAHAHKHAHSHAQEKHEDHDHEGHDHDHDDDGHEDHAHEHEGDHEEKEEEAHADQKEGMNENTEGMLLHVIADLLGSVAVVFASGFTAKGWYRVDPACSVAMNAFILVEAFSLMKRTSEILLLRSPDAYIEKLKPEIEKLSLLDGVVNVTNQHVWQCSSAKVVGSVHFIVEHERFSHGYVEDLLFRVHRAFAANGINDTTVQIQPNKRCEEVGKQKSIVME